MILLCLNSLANCSSSSRSTFSSAGRSSLGTWGGDGREVKRECSLVVMGGGEVVAMESGAGSEVGGERDAPRGGIGVRLERARETMGWCSLLTPPPPLAATAAAFFCILSRSLALGVS